MSISAASQKPASASFPELWTKQEVAAFLRITVGTVDKWRREGRLPEGRKIGRDSRWNATEIRRLAGLE